MNPKNQPITINHEKLVFVFGSNYAGVHNKGTARDAQRFYGAERQRYEGISNMSYALPTKNAQQKILPINTISQHVSEFLWFAEEHPEMEFIVTRVGCCADGYADAEIFPLFTDRPSNVLLPGTWLAAMGELNEIRLIIAGGRDFNDFQLLSDRIDFNLSRSTQPVRIVSGCCQGVDKLGERYYAQTQLPTVTDLTKMPAAWKIFNLPAGYLRNFAMAWYSTHLIAFWDGESDGTKSMISLGKSENLKSRVVCYPIQKA